MAKQASKSKKAVAMVIGGLVLLGGGAAIDHHFLPVVKTVEVEKVVTQEVVKEVPGPERIVEKTVEVAGPVQLVDNEKLADVLEYIWDNDGNVSVVLDDLEESEVAEIADRMVMVSDFQALAMDAAREQARTELHRETVNGTRLDKEDIERLKVQEDDVLTDVTDWDDKDAEVTVPVFFEQDDVKYKADIIVSFKDGELDEVLADSVSLR